ncbi:hypothetical protein KIY73_gp37 [Mycobacterium phage Camperdownii]|uniref:Uncharacterized protein n=1 Tax=Mycobacterium phage Camperdownii TaxID=1927024 RepID=A0A1L5C0M2_9CAUD|nr:hypothetical protein KIY73_gp37 [Mycobacterium phage Camperdownii]APL99631.1 hypothetical protein SEA_CAMPERDOWNII_37 [Mycobacterium phage Camperdownii]
MVDRRLRCSDHSGRAAVSEVLLKIEKRSDGLHYVEWMGKEFALLRSPIQHSVEYASHPWADRIRMQFDMSPLPPPPPPKPKRTWASAMGLRKPRGNQ